MELNETGSELESSGSDSGQDKDRHQTYVATKEKINE